MSIFNICYNRQYTTISSLRGLSLAFLNIWVIYLPIPGWCILVDSIGYAERLHRWCPAHFTSPLCSVCHDYTETSFHFFVDCDVKRLLWYAILENTPNQNVFNETDNLWRALSTLTPAEDKLLSSELLTTLGNGVIFVL
jgi:hypothetical protein